MPDVGDGYASSTAKVNMANPICLIKEMKDLAEFQKVAEN